MVWERHRHRYEINPEYIEKIERGNPNSPEEKFADLGINGGDNDRPITPPPSTIKRQAPTTPNLTGWDKDPIETAKVNSKSENDQLRFVGKDEKGERMQIAELIGE